MAMLFVRGPKEHARFGSPQCAAKNRTKLQGSCTEGNGSPKLMDSERGQMEEYTGTYAELSANWTKCAEATGESKKTKLTGWLKNKVTRRGW
jgi:hypothetical protein